MLFFLIVLSRVYRYYFKYGRLLAVQKIIFTGKIVLFTITLYIVNAAMKNFNLVIWPGNVKTGVIIGNKERQVSLNSYSIG